MMVNYYGAVIALVGGTVTGPENGPISEYIFESNQTPPTEAEIQAKIIELQADYDAKQYQRDRAKAYPTWQDQLDTIYHAGIDAWKAEIKAIKDQHPKPTE